MHRSAALIALVLMVMSVTGFAADPEPAKPETTKHAFTFADVEYFHRWTKGDQHEFTPAGQDDLDAWTDMVTIWQYPEAKDGDALAKVANVVLGKYHAAKGKVIRTTSVPRTDNKPAEHLTVVVFTRDEFSEIAFARFKMHDGIGSSVVYSHRFYGKDASEKMRDWIPKNGQKTEKALMKWDQMPKLSDLPQSP